MSDRSEIQKSYLECRSQARKISKDQEKLKLEQGACERFRCHDLCFIDSYKLNRQYFKCLKRCDEDWT